ncbi:hypothetical protein BGX27_004027 [Mortierella sp. AM989]|nr:hypothetical protein BGX27_004027 [Mortierella sp. AM989]
MYLSPIAKNTIQQIAQLILEGGVPCAFGIAAATFLTYSVKVASQQTILEQIRTLIRRDESVKLSPGRPTWVFLLITFFLIYTKISLAVVNTVWQPHAVYTVGKAKVAQPPPGVNFTVNTDIFNQVMQDSSLCSMTVGCGAGIGTSNVTYGATDLSESLQYTPSGLFYDSRQFVLAPFSYWNRLALAPPFSDGNCNWTYSTTGNITIFELQTLTGGCLPTSDSLAMLAQIDRSVPANGYLLPATNDFGLLVPGMWWKWNTQTTYKKTMIRLSSPDADYIVESDGAIAQIWKPLDGCFDPAAAMKGLGFDTSLVGTPYCSGFGGRQAVTVTNDGYVIEATIIEPGYQGTYTYQLFYRREYKIMTFPAKGRGKAVLMNTGPQYELYNDVGTPWRFYFAKDRAWKPKEDVMNYAFNGSTVRQHIISALYDSYNFQGVGYSVSMSFRVTMGWIVYHVVISAVGIALLASAAIRLKYRQYNNTLSTALMSVINPDNEETAKSRIEVEYGVEPGLDRLSLIVNGKIVTSVDRNFTNYNPSMHSRILVSSSSSRIKAQYPQ